MIGLEKINKRFQTTVALVVFIIVGIFFMLNIKLILDFWMDILNNIEWMKGNLLIYSTITIYAITLVLASTVLTEIVYRFFWGIAEKILKNKYKNIKYLLLGMFNFILKVHIAYFLLIFIGFCIADSIDPFGDNKITKLVSISANNIYESDISNLSAELNSITLYNGTSIVDATESSIEIKQEVDNIIKGSKTDRERAKKIYDWVGTNITYDTELANNLSEEMFNNTFGAKYAYYNKSGICFDFASLYAVMAMESDMKVKLVIGKAFDGESFGAHAWNEVYLDDEEKWINVDATFWGQEDSFDSISFEDTHIAEKIAGEW